MESDRGKVKLSMKTLQVSGIPSERFLFDSHSHTHESVIIWRYLQDTSSPLPRHFMTFLKLLTSIKTPQNFHWRENLSSHLNLTLGDISSSTYSQTLFISFMRCNFLSDRFSWKFNVTAVYRMHCGSCHVISVLFFLTDCTKNSTCLA